MVTAVTFLPAVQCVEIGTQLSARYATEIPNIDKAFQRLRYAAVRERHGDGGVWREDAMKVAITRDGKIYLGSDRIDSENLSAKIQERLKDREVERKVYIVADMRVRWGSVEAVLDGVRSAGIVRVAFMAEKRRLPSFTR